METTQSNKLYDLQQRLEAVVQSPPQNFGEVSVEDIRQLVYEVQTYRIQLEMQNEKLRQIQHQLEEARNKYSDLFDFAPVGYFTISENGLVLEVNLTGAKLVGESKSNLIGTPIAQYVARDNQDQFYVYRQRIIESKSNETCELKLLKKDGRQFYVRLEGIVVPDSAGNFNKFHLSVTDITEHRQTEERLRQQEKLAAVGQLAGGIAHDFNNILQTIIGFAELLTYSHQDLSPDLQYGLQHINQQGQSAAQLVRQLLDFSRRSMSQQHPLALAPLLQQVLKLLKRTIPENIRVCLNCAPGQYWIKGDVVQLEQALLNLAVNARDAMPLGGTLDLSLSRRKFVEGQPLPMPEMPCGEWIVIRVSDTGTGISESILPHIFEPFFTTKSQDEGTGLGLAQIYSIVRQHNGYINVTSQVGQGTTFTLYLPSLSLLVETLPDYTNEIDVPHGHGEMILLVEDEPVVLAVTQSMLHHLDYHVLTATNGYKALEIYDQYLSDIPLILTDMTMPNMDGVALTQALWEKNPNLKVIIMTGYLLESKVKELLNQGQVEYLRKPLRIDQLAQVISRFLQLGKAEFA